MKKYMALICCVAAVFGTASADVLFSEDFESVSISSDSPISLFGWANDIEANDNRVYTGNAVWSYAVTYTEAFYTTEGMGAGFTSFDISSAPGLTFAVDNQQGWQGEVTSGYFCLQLNGSDWYVSATPVAGSGTWTTRTMEFDPSAGAWYTLAVSDTGSVGTGGAVIGANPLSDLSGTVTGVGFVITRSGEGSQNFDNFSVYTPTVTSPPAAPNVQKIWMNGTTAKLYWQASLTATNYMVKSSSNSGGPYTPVADAGNILSFAVSNLVVGTTNYFVIAAENEAGEGDPSSELVGVVQNYSIFADSDSSWGDWLFSYKEAAFDSDTATFYESPNATAAYVGADFGAGNEIMPVEILYHPTIGKDAALALLVGAEFQGSNDGTTWDTLATITSQPTVDWHSVFAYTSTAYRYIRLWFTDGNSTIHGTIGEIAFGTNIPPFRVTVSPAAGSALPGPTNITLSAEIVEWDSEFDSAALYLNDALVASDNTPSGDGTNLLSYAAGELAVGSYTGKVVATGVNPSAMVTNEWTFEILSTPSPTASKLWNINMAGNEYASQTVTDGTVIRAPSTGLDQWNNLISPYDSGAGGDTNENTWLPTNALEIVDASGGNPIGLKWTGTDQDWNVEPTPADELFIGYFGSSGFNSTMEISGLDPDSKYDIYVYFTWGWSANAWINYTVTEGGGAITNRTLKPNNANVDSGTYSDIVRGENYVVFTQLSPSLTGNIHINAISDDGGWSALQIAEVSGTGPTVNPAIQSISVADGTVTLQWASETGVSYSILRKIHLTDGSWSVVTNNISGGDPTTTDAVPASGADAEFYIIEGQ